MRLQQLTEVLFALETDPSRLEAVRRIARLLDAAAPAERTRLVYLLQGRLAPAYLAEELDVGERVLVAVLARTYGVPAGRIDRSLAGSGDLGLVAERLASPATPPRLSVAGAYAALRAAAALSGGGSADRRIELLAGLLRRATPREARYLVRIAQGRLRLGVGDATIVAGAALGALGDHRRAPEIEAAYNVRADLGAVVTLAYARGARGLARIGPRVGVPIRPALAQRLPSADAIIRRLGGVDAEPKYDGFRLQVHRSGDDVRLFSRRLEDVTAMFPELVAAARRQLPRRVIVEGEAVAVDPRTGRFLPFQVTMTRKRKYGVREAAARHPLRLVLFDVLLVGGRSCLPLAQRERHRRLARLVRGSAPITVTEVLHLERPAAVESYFRDMLARGLEGVVAKRPDAPYRAGARGFDWVKLKRAYHERLRDTVDVVLVGYTRGRGKRSRLGIGSLLGAVYDPEGDRFRTVARIGSGLADDRWIALRRLLDADAIAARPARVDSRIAADVWVEPRRVVEVLADEITRSPRHTCGSVRGGPGYALRFPRILGDVRGDKGPADATTEREVLELYRLQRRAAGTPREGLMITSRHVPHRS